MTMPTLVRASTALSVGRVGHPHSSTSGSSSVVYHPSPGIRSNWDRFCHNNRSVRLAGVGEAVRTSPRGVEMISVAIP